jgi:hypothetical protein
MTPVQHAVRAGDAALVGSVLKYQRIAPAPAGECSLYVPPAASKNGTVAVNDLP